jgi:uncharacterized protein (DUF1330 family)
VAAYIIAFIEVTDPERNAQYLKLTPDAIARHGGTLSFEEGKLTLGGPAENR